MPKETSQAVSNESRELRKAGLKVTEPRIKVLKVLESESSQHLSAEDVYKKLLDTKSDVGLATVYRVLTQFETAGLVTRHHFESGHSVFELTGKHHHDHMVCLECGAVEEFCDEVIETRQKEIAESLGFEIRQHTHSLFGVCAVCQKKHAETPG